MTTGDRRERTIVPRDDASPYVEGRHVPEVREMSDYWIRTQVTERQAAYLREVERQELADEAKRGAVKPDSGSQPGADALGDPLRHRWQLAVRHHLLPHGLPHAHLRPHGG